MTFAERFHNERAHYIMSGKAQIGTNEPEHCYLGAREWAEFEAETNEIRYRDTGRWPSEIIGPIVYCGVEMHRLLEPSHFRFS